MKLLFICTHNRCRSILAEAITNHVANPLIQAASAGSTPEGMVHPLSLLYLSGHGVPIDGLKSQSWHDCEDYNPDAVVTLCDSAAQESCPIWFGNTVQVHWGLKDPSKQLEGSNQIEAFNNTINVIERRISRLLDTLKASKTIDSQQLRSTLIQIAAEIN
jgi:arsenate reductase